jgi:anti-sigma B factor antagonist
MGKKKMERLSTIVVKLPEFFGAKAARKLGRELNSKITDSNPHVILDLSRVKRIDSKGLDALLTCMEKIAKQDGALQFGHISPEAATLFELTRMDRLFQKFPSFAAEAPAFTLSADTVAEHVTADEAAAEGSVQLPVAA